MRISDWSSDVCSSDLLARRLRCDLQVKGGGIEVGVSEQSLDDADVDAVLEQVGGKAVAQGVRPDALVDIGRLSRLDDDAVELSGAVRVRVPRAEPALRYPPDRTCTPLNSLHLCPSRIPSSSCINTLFIS